MRARLYISSAVYYGHRTPQHIQNIVLREYCKKNGFQFSLSMTEYDVTDIPFVFNSLLGVDDEWETLICFSVRQLPIRVDYTIDLLRAFLDKHITVHFVEEGIVIKCETDLHKVEDLLLLWNFDLDNIFNHQKY